MAKTVLIAGKDMPSGSKFADGMALSGRKITITGPEAQQDEDDDSSTVKQINVASGIAVCEWHRTSAVSARTLVLNAETAFDKVDEAVLFFDEEWYASFESPLSTEECLRVCDELIFSYQCLALEILARYEKKNSSGTPGFLIFLLKDTPSVADAMRTPAVRNGVSAIASAAIASAAASFAAFAENIAVQYGNQSYVNVLLVRGNRNMDVVASDVELGKWLGTYLQTLEDTAVEFSAKKSVTWVKPGTKVSSGGLTSLFGKK